MGTCSPEAFVTVPLLPEPYPCLASVLPSATLCLASFCSVSFHRRHRESYYSYPTESTDLMVSQNSTRPSHTSHPNVGKKQKGPNSFCGISITVIPKPDYKNKTKQKTKKNYSSLSLTNTDAKILIQLLAEPNTTW